MNERSPWLAPLQLLAAGLGVAIVVLFVLWLHLEPATFVPTDANDPDVETGNPEALQGPNESQEPAASDQTARPPMGRVAGPVESKTAAVLYGAVWRADREPIDQGWIWLYRQGKQVASASIRNGSYAFSGLRVGEYSLRSRIEDQLPIDLDVKVEAPSTRRDIDLVACWLLTVNAVTPDGQPLLQEARKRGVRLSRGITAAAFSEPLAGDLPLSNSAEVKVGLGPFRGGSPFASRGRKAMPKQTVGILTLPAGKRVHVALMMRNHLVMQLPVPPEQDEVTFTIAVDAFLAHMATVHLRLVDRRGTPLSGIRVALNDAQTGGGGVKTGEDGCATLKYLKPGRLDLEIWHQDLRAPPVQVDVGMGAKLDLGDIVMIPGIRAEVVMDNFGGKGSVRIHWRDRPPRGMTLDDIYLSNSGAPSRTITLYPGRYSLLASAPNGVAILERNLQVSPAPAIRFDLKPGAPLHIENRVGSGYAQLRLYSASGALVRRREVTGKWSQTVQLPPGEYRAAITDARGAVTDRKVTLTRAGATLTIR